MIDEPTWKKGYNYLILKKKNYQYQDTDLYPLKGALKCEHCGHPMTTSPSRGNSGIVPYYECRQKDCKKLRVNVKDAHIKFEALLTAIQSTNRVIKLYQHLIFTEWNQAINDARAAADRMDRRVLELKDELKSIRKAKDDGIYTAEQAKEEAEKIQQDLMVVEIERSELRIEQYNAEAVREFTGSFLKNLALLWGVMDLPKRQAFLQEVFMGTVVCTANKEIRTSELSPSFQLIEALKAEKGENVTPRRVELRLPG